MFCTQCGIQIDTGDNFCRGCGAKLGRGSEPSPTYLPSRASTEPTAAVRSAEASSHRQQTMPLSPPRDGVDSNKTKIIGAAVVVVVLAAAGVYFGTDLLRQPTPSETKVAEAPIAHTQETPLAPATEKNKSSDEGSEKSQSSRFEPIAPEAASPPPVETPALAPKPASRQSRVKPVGQDAPTSNHANQPAASASRRGASPGIYQTLRSTTVFESPSASARSVANIPGGIRVSVVSTSGDWLEVHSRRGNPPGFIRREDAQFIESGQ
jgi:cytoskeletal protein RodZ